MCCVAIYREPAMEPTVSQKLIELVRHRLGRSDYGVKVSDQSVAKALKISRPVLIECKNGHRPIPHRSFIRATNLLGLPIGEALNFKAELDLEWAMLIRLEPNSFDYETDPKHV
jgi:hypothetical protein